MNTRRTSRMGRLGRAVLLGTAVTAGGCNPHGSASAPAPLRADVAPDWRVLVGCYQVEHLRFVLDTVPVVTGWRGRESARQARSLPVGERTGKRFWLVTPRNALEVVFEDGLWATRLELVVRGDSLTGNRHIYGDQPSVPPTVEPAAGVREPCPADVADAWHGSPRRVDPFVRSIDREAPMSRLTGGFARGVDAHRFTRFQSTVSLVRICHSCSSVIHWPAFAWSG